jgi:hypothetical protein
VAALGPGTTLLVDTYDTEQGIRTAVEVAGTGLGAVRLDSGDPATEARRARALLDDLGATETRIVSTGDLDEYALEALATEPIDRYGVGTSLVTGSGAPTAGFVYKLVAIAREDGPDAPLAPVAKRSAGKSTVGGRKWSYRLRSPEDGTAREVLRLAPGGEGQPLQAPLPERDDVEAARATCAAALAALPAEARRLDDGPPAWVARRRWRWRNDDRAVRRAHRPGGGRRAERLRRPERRALRAAGRAGGRGRQRRDRGRHRRRRAGLLHPGLAPAGDRALRQLAGALRAGHLGRRAAPRPAGARAGRAQGPARRGRLLRLHHARPATGETTPTALANLLKAADAERLVVVGLAGDVCVRATALDGAQLGWPVTVPWSAVRSVEVNAGDDARTREELAAAGVVVRDG